MEKLVEHVIGDVIAIFDRPLFLFGHSMGAVVAYEAALALKEKIGREPDGLIVSGHGSPDSIDPDARWWHTANEEELIDNIHTRRIPTLHNLLVALAKMHASPACPS